MIRVLLILFLSSCSIISYNELPSLIRGAILGGPDLLITDAYINASEYSFMKAKFGKGSPVILVLLEINSDNQFIWISEEGEKIYTKNGKVIKTEGLIHDLTLYNYKQDIKNFIPSIQVQYAAEFINPRAMVYMKSSFNLTEEQSFYELTEHVITTGFNWNVKNLYHFNKDSLLPTYTKQFLNPKLPELEIFFYYK